MADATQRLVVVSNRLPVLIADAEGEWTITPGAGGLITALEPVLRRRSGLWIGWPAAPPGAPTSDLLASVSAELGHTMVPVTLEEDVVQGYYRGFSNETLWPLFHDMLDRCLFDQSHWANYRAANARFAEAIVEATTAGDLLWVHDYHLLLVAHQLREMGARRRTLFFLHIPFPTPDLFRRLPWRRQILEAMLQYHLLGFQTEHDRRNFVRCVRDLLPEAAISQRRRVTFIQHRGMESRMAHFPISIDFGEFSRMAESKEAAEAAWIFHENLPKRKIVLGVDRLDYTKGIQRRFLAFENLLERHPEIHGQLSMVQILIPSRTEVPEYQAWKSRLDELVGKINGRFYKDGWVPIHYSYRHLERPELVGHYRAAEIGLVTPLRDGMNLVSKEYCASHVDNDGVLILSEFSGAAAQLHVGAILVNPYDIEGVADAIHQAFVMEPEEQQRRMKRLRAEVRRYDVHRWADAFLRASAWR
jgi:trehalose 6-phosphate synthase/phosphatase